MKNQVIHYDLFAGIGGFSLALDNIYGKQNTRHIFVERDEFCQLVLKKHWPEADYYSCINEFNSYAKHKRLERSKQNETQRYFGQCSREYGNKEQIVLTGGFPCQPFSQAGQRKGTADDRYLWPAMFESIRLIRPDWIIAENVAGLVTWNEGMVLEQVCSDLESEGYEVQPFIIPACAVNAPHRRDRVWIVANRSSERRNNGADNRQERQILHNENGDAPQNQPERQGRECGVGQNPSITPNSEGGRQRWSESERDRGGQSEETLGNCNRNASDTESQHSEKRATCESYSWDENWDEVAASLCRMADGLSYWVDRRGKKRNSRIQRLKALGNSIVPQVAEIIFRQITHQESNF